MGRLDKALKRIKDRESGTAQLPVSAARAEVKNLNSSLGTAGIDPFSKARKVHLHQDTLAENRIISSTMDPAIRTAYKMLRTRLLHIMRTNGWQSLAVTSATQGDGKTITAINLAISIAGDVNHNVCLVDLDLRRSSIADYLGLELTHGISDCLERKLSLDKVIIKPNIDRLFVVPNNTTETHSSEILSSPIMQDLAYEMVRDPSRMVIYDMPPVLAADDMLAFAPNVDAVLFVAAKGKTARTDVMKAYELLENLQIVGTVFNRSDEKTAAYY